MRQKISIPQNYRRLVWPTSLLIVAVVLFTVSLLVYNLYKWTPMSYHIDLRPMVTRFPAFNVNLTAIYDINLKVERNIPFEQLVCLLGLEKDFNKPLCKNLASPIELEWILYSNGVTVKEGTSSRKLSGGYGSTVSRCIGAVSLEKGKDYVLEVVSLHDASVLAPTDPRIAVEIQAPIYEPYGVIAQLLLILAVLCGSIGIAWIAFRMRILKKVKI